MSVLVDKDIEHAVLISRDIVIEPFHREKLGTNSYDVHLARTLRVYKREFEHVMHVPDINAGMIGAPKMMMSDEIPLDARVPRETIDIEIPDDGYVLQPGELYLASTIEYTESHVHLPLLNGKSSIGRLGLSIHVTAGTGDVGFCGHWTLELFVIKPLRVYAGMAVGQLLWFDASDTPAVPYNMKRSAKYNNRDPLPMASKLHQEITRAQSEE